MTEWSDLAAILVSLHNATGEFAQLRSRLPEDMNPQGPRHDVFDGFPGSGGAGAAVSISAAHDDGRKLDWLVEIWLDQWHDGQWSAQVKGEIDVDDDAGDDRCVLNEQRTAHTAEQAVAAIRELTDLVVSYPVDELLAWRWPPEDEDELDDAHLPEGAVVHTQIVITERLR